MIKVSDRMVNEAWAAYCKLYHQSVGWEIPMRAAIEAALAAHEPIRDIQEEVYDICQRGPA